MLKRPFPLRSTTLLAAACVAATAFLAPGCADGVQPGTGGTGGTGGGGAPMLAPGELCTPPSASNIALRIEPAQVFVPTCAAGSTCVTRPVRLVVDPDLCPPANPQDAADTDVPIPAAITVTTENGDIVPAPEGGTVGLHQPTLTLAVKGGAKTGTVKLVAHLPITAKDASGKRVAGEKTVEFTVTTIDPTPISCAGTDDVKLSPLKADVAPVLDGSGKYTSGDNSIHGGGTLEGASIGLQERSDAPNSNSFLWRVNPFMASIACSPDITPPGYVALGPAVTFGPTDLAFNREIPFSVPINPALLPEKARLRHVRVVYSGPAFKAPRTVAVADPRIEQVGAEGQWALEFKAPRLGTYQVVVAKDAGTRTRKRRITHRAVIGISMGGGGTATFGMRHHDKFDVLAPLGGPVSWTWMLDYIDQNHLGGFRSIPKGTTLKDIQQVATTCVTGAECKPDETCVGVLPGPMTPGKCTIFPEASDPYLHPQAYNSWWYEYPRAGNGGSFSRVDYAQIFRDLALMYGNPNGENLSPDGENLPAGVNPSDKSVAGEHTGGECHVWVDPIDPGENATAAQVAEYEKQQQIADTCPKERCANTLSLGNYHDDEYNPDGAFPVITVCDSSAQDATLTPYANTWKPGATQYPLEVALAVDYNGNGVRDEMEPLIRAGHEPWADFGADGLPSSLEPGYKVGVNEDPAGDDYNAQYNPTGTEDNHRLDAGEKFDDVGLDGVAGTVQQPATGYAKPGDGYDVGEGDGKFTASRGLQRFWDRDAYSIARKMVDPQKVPGGELTEEALARIDVWTDGGTRDLFNFAVDAQHLAGGFAARGRDALYLTEPSQIAGLGGDVRTVPGDANSPKVPADYNPSRVNYEDLQGIVFQRYGKIDPTANDIEAGSGQHVGTAPELIKRLQGALYFIGSRWREPSLVRQHPQSQDNPIAGLDECEVLGTCTIAFTSKSGRVGPVGITLPPGYAHADLEEVRYPVIYMLHGYGQSPEDLEAAVALLSNWMNSPLDSGASRLPKAIIVYVDGRCRIANGKPECLRGTFFADSVRPTGAQDEQWWLELMDHMDKNYRTLGETEVDWTE